MNIALIIGISEYDTQQNLAACSADAENMFRLLDATQKYDEIKVVTEQTTVLQVKAIIREFFRNHQSSSIDEALIYFSGHGVYKDDALLCCTDFNIKRPTSTSISNDELDNLLRSVNPQVAVKIIDACYSGSQYIKDIDSEFEKALRKSQLESFICMASSRQDQVSIANLTESHFTARLIEAVLHVTDGEILYRDMQAAVADAFAGNTKQTPFFTNQGTGLEVFSTVTAEMKELWANYSNRTVVSTSKSSVEQQVEAMVNELDELFIAHDEVLLALDASKDALDVEAISDQLVAKYYSLHVGQNKDLRLIPRGDVVASFAAQQSWPNRYFVRIHEQGFQKRMLKNPLVGLAGFNNAGDDDYVTVTEMRPVTVETTEDLPFEFLEITFIPNRSSLPVYAAYIGLVHSRTEVVVISSAARNLQTGWEKQSTNLEEITWRYSAFNWAEIVKDPPALWRDVIAYGELAVRNYLNSLVPEDQRVQEAIADCPSDHEADPDTLDS